MGTFNAGLDGVTIQSEGCKLLGGLYRAAGFGPRPTAILLHGDPGIEKNLDVAYRLRDNGWNCLYFHYRGSWGSGGAFSLAGHYDDLLAATAWLENQPCVDSNRLALIGSSSGGYLALTAGAMDSRFKAIVGLCPLLSTSRAPFPVPVEAFDEDERMLIGVTSKELKSQYEALTPIETKAEQLRNRSILILTGRQDEVLHPQHYSPLMEVCPNIEWREFSNGDHALSLCRQEVVQRTVDWLVAHMGQ